MIRMEKERYVDGNYNAVLDLQVSTVAELPDLGDTIGLYTVAPGSIAQIIQADEPTFVTLDDDGTWYPEQSDSRSLSLTKTLETEQPEIKSEELTEPEDDEPSEREIEQPVKEQKKEFVESVEEPEREEREDDEE